MTRILGSLSALLVFACSIFPPDVVQAISSGGGTTAAEQWALERASRIVPNACAVHPGLAQLRAVMESIRSQPVLLSQAEMQTQFERAGVAPKLSLEETLRKNRDLQRLQQLSTELGVDRHLNLKLVPEAERWHPTEADIQRMTRLGQTKGVSISRDAVLKAARFLRPGDDEEHRFKTVVVTSLLVLAIIAGEGYALAVFVYRILTHEIEFSCEGLILTILAGGISSVLIYFEYYALTPSYVAFVLTGVSSAEFLSEGAIAEFLAGKVSIVADFICPIFTRAFWVSSDDRNLITTSLSDAIFDEYGEGLMALAELGEATSIADNLSLDLGDSQGNTQSDFDLNESVYWTADFQPHSNGTLVVELLGGNNGTSHLLATRTIDPPYPLPLLGSFPAADLAELTSGDNFLSMWLRVTEGGNTVELDESMRPIIRVADHSQNNFAPLLLADWSTQLRILTVSGSYSDANGDLPTSLLLHIDGTTQSLLPLPEGDPSVCGGAPGTCVPFELSRTLAEGVHDVYLEANDGHGGTARIPSSGSWKVRASTTQPTVLLDLQQMATDINAPVALSVQLTDSIGPIPDRQIRLSIDGRGYFRDEGGSPKYFVQTNQSGVASAEVVPTASGQRTIVAQDTVSKRFDYSFLTVAGDDPSDWSHEWTFTEVSNNSNQAVYDIQVLIRYQNGYLDPGDDVHFSVNHGSLAVDTDEVETGSRVVRNRYTLTKVEADSGDEIFTLDLRPQYNQQLTFVTNLPVGDPPPLVPIGSRAFQGDNQDRQSFSVAYSKDGRYAANTSGNFVILHDLRDDSTVSIDLDRNDVNCVEFSPDSTLLAAGDSDGNISIITIASRTFIRRSRTDGRADILTLDWYSPTRIAASTQGFTGYLPRVLVLDPSLNVIREQTFPNVSENGEVQRVACNSVANVCGAAIDDSDATRWFLFTTSGQIIQQGQHPEANPIWTVSINPAGTRFFVGGADFNGATWSRLFSVSGSTATEIPAPISSNTKIFASQFFQTPQGNRLALGGNRKIELFSENGGPVLENADDPNVEDDSYHLDFLDSQLRLAAIDNVRQTFYNLSGDYFGPSISIAPVAPLAYLQDHALVAGSAQDPAGVASARRQIGAGPSVDLGISGSGNLAFSFEATALPIGDTPVTIRATDIFGNETISGIVLTRLDDTTPPVVSETAVSPQSAPAGAEFTVESRVEDSESGVASVQATIVSPPGAPLQQLPMTPSHGATFSAAFDSTGLTEGVYSVRIDATDVRGNTRTVNDASSFSVTECHTLTLNSVGDGAAPVPSPMSSSGCPSGMYPAGEVISLDASPGADSGWTLGSCCQNSCGGWTGTDNDASRSEQNQVTMPSSDHSVSVIYTQQCNTPPVAIALIDFEALAGDEGVVLKWQTGFEIDNLGFHLYREDNSGSHRITPSPIAGSALLTGSALTQGYSYTWIDPVGKEDASYWLEDIDLDGTRTPHGPFPVTGRLGASPEGRVVSKTLPKLGRSAISPSPGHAIRWDPDQAEALETRLATQRWLAASDSLKILVREEGVYRINQPELLAAGLPQDVDPRSLRLFTEGVEIPTLVSGEDDGVFDPADFIVFHGFPKSTPWTETRTYWLVAGDEPGLRLRLVQTSGSTNVTGFPETLEWKPRTTYFSALLNGDAENFFGPVVSDEAVVQTFGLPFLERSSRSTARLGVDLQGVAGEHAISISVNGVRVGKMEFSGMSHGDAEFDLPAGILNPGDNEVRLAGAGTGEDISLVDQVRLTYPRRAATENDRLALEILGGSQVRVTGFTEPGILAIDVTDPARPMLLNTSPVREGNQFSALVAAPSGQLRRILVSSLQSPLGPERISANRPSRLSAEESGADAVFVTHNGVEPEITRLQRFREAQGRYTLSANVEDIYDEYSFGSPTPYALRDFLRAGAASWRITPRFLVLAGDATLDPKNYLGYGRVDSVPTRIAPSLHSETANDGWFGDLDGDGAADLAVGRLPVETRQEAQAVVDKIIAYETRPVAGDWRSSALLVSDWQGDFPFDQESSRLRSLLPANWHVTELSRSQEDSADTVRQAFLRGQALVGYLGHGSVQRWAGGLLDSDEAFQLGNGSRLPFVISMACLTGLFQGERQSLAEALLLAPSGGAIAVLASPSLDGARQQVAFGEAVYGRLFADTSRTIGEVVEIAKKDPDTPGSVAGYVFFGDPMTRLVASPPDRPNQGWRPRN